MWHVAQLSRVPLATKILSEKKVGGRWQATGGRWQVSGVRWQVAYGRWQVACGRW